MSFDGLHKAISAVEKEFTERVGMLENEIVKLKKENEELKERVLSGESDDRRRRHKEAWNNFGQTMFKGGKHEGMTFAEVYVVNRSYASWIERMVARGEKVVGDLAYYLEWYRMGRSHCYIV